MSPRHDGSMDTPQDASQDAVTDGTDGTATSRPDGATRAANDAMHVRRAFGEPIVREGVTIVPVARVTGGAGEGRWSGRLDGTGPGERAQGAGSGSGAGGGFGVRVRPLGVYVVDGSQVRWEPAFDLARAILGGQVLVAVIALTVAWVRRKRR